MKIALQVWLERLELRITHETESVWLGVESFTVREDSEFKLTLASESGLELNGTRGSRHGAVAGSATWGEDSGTFAFDPPARTEL